MKKKMFTKRQSVLIGTTIVITVTVVVLYNLYVKDNTSGTLNEEISEVTKKVIENFNSMNERESMNKYSTSKRFYAKRLEKYGDPYMNAPLAKIGKFLGGN